MRGIDYYKYRHYFDEIINTFAPIHWLLKVFSLHCQISKQKNASSSKHILRIAIPAVILFGVTSFIIYCKIVYIYENLLATVKYTDAVQTVYDYFQYIVDLLFVFKYGTDFYYEYIKQYAYIDDILGMTFYDDIKRGVMTVMAIICFHMCSCVYDYFIWFHAYGFFSTTTFALPYLYIFIKNLTNLDFSSHVMHIESRLHLIGDTIQDCYSSFENVCSKIEDTITKSNWFYNEYSFSTRDVKVRPLKKKTSLNFNDVKYLSRCYLLLTEQVMFINKMFGMRMLLNNLCFLIDIVRFINITVRILIGSQYTGFDDRYIPAISLIWRIVICVITPLSAVTLCEGTYRQRERIVRLIDHMIFEKSLDDQLTASFKELRSLVESRTITFHMATFSTLNNSLLVSIASVVVTYTIILLSFN